MGSMICESKPSVPAVCLWETTDVQSLQDLRQNSKQSKQPLIPGETGVQAYRERSAFCHQSPRAAVTTMRQQERPPLIHCNSSHARRPSPSLQLRLIVIPATKTRACAHGLDMTRSAAGHTCRKRVQGSTRSAAGVSREPCAGTPNTTLKISTCDRQTQHTHPHQTLPANNWSPPDCHLVPLINSSSRRQLHVDIHA